MFGEVEQIVDVGDERLERGRVGVEAGKLVNQRSQSDDRVVNLLETSDRELADRNSVEDVRHVERVLSQN